MGKHTVTFQHTPGSTTLSFKARSLAVMDYAACHVVYVDKRAREERFVRKDGLASSAVTRSNERALDYSNVHEDLAESEEVQMNVQAILSVFNGGMFYNALESTSWSSFGSKQHHQLGGADK